TAPGGYLYFADMTGAFDDDAATVFGASSIWGPYTLPPAREGTLVGNIAFVATVAGLYAYDVTAMMDEMPGTTLGALTPSTALTGFDFDGVYSSGSMALLSPGTNG